MFSLNQELVERASALLGHRRDLYWVIGGACSGKSTICRAISAQTGIALYDMDEKIFGGYTYSPQRHPASTAWFSAANPLAWVMGLSWEEFNALNRAANAEYLDLLAHDLATQPPKPLLVDGGITHPSVLAAVIPAVQIVCIETSDEDRTQTWESAPERAEMKQWIHALPNPEEMWRKFLSHDEQMTRIIVAESHTAGIRVFTRNEMTSVEMLTGQVMEHFGLQRPGSEETTSL
jgi:hypothetical protein